MSILDQLLDHHPEDDVPTGWVIVPKLARLWASVPAHERVTHDLMRERVTAWHERCVLARAPYATPDRLAHDLAKELARLDPPHCEIATQGYLAARYGAGPGGKLWVPCGMPIAEGATRCRKHGGPSVGAAKQSRQTYDDLRAERDALAAQLAAIADADGGAA